MKRMIGASVIAVCAMAFAVSSANAATVIKPYFEFKKPKMIAIDGDLSLDTNGASGPVFGSSSGSAPSLSIGFEGVSQYDGARFARNFIPPDTMGAVGLTQYMETTNGAYAVFDKYTGAQLSIKSDVAFWAGAGQTGANGDSRIMYNADAKRWIAISFGNSVSDIQIAISNTDNALGSWKSTKFTGFAGGTADYPTLALDKNAVYIGTNNFAPSFKGTTLNVIPIDSLFSALAPTTSGMKQFVTPYTGGASDVDGGFALQGVNSSTSGSTGTVLAASLFFYDNLAYKVNDLTSTSAAAATLTTPVYIGEAGFVSPGPGRQPDAVADTDINLADTITNNKRVVATLDERISSSVYEANGRIYSVHTVNSTADGLDEARIRYTVIDANTFAILDEGDIGSAGYDYYQGSIAVNRLGQVVIGYNRSGLDPTTGKITFLARTFNTDANGKLVSTGGELFLKESLVDDYHNGSVAGQVANGRQRWGDYSQVSLDPSTAHGFYLIGEFAREYNNAAGGHAGGTGGSRWGTWIAGIDAGSVPEPANWAMMIAGFGIVGGAMRRRRTTVRFQIA
jgi:hypothetical protein